MLKNEKKLFIKGAKKYCALINYDFIKVLKIFDNLN